MNPINALLPESALPFERAQAKVISITSIGLCFALLTLVLYWLVTNTLEQIETIFISLGFVILFAGIVALVKRGYIKTGAWLITGLMLFLNLSNMAWYGIGNWVESTRHAFTNK